jgi:Zn finger protein HypA/HybF involved in hydrogenase expression
MAAMKINRFNLSEIENVTFCCKACGAGHILTLDRDALLMDKCPSCGKDFGKISRDIFHSLREAAFALRMTEDFDVEFDIVEE